MSRRGGPWCGAMKGWSWREREGGLGWRGARPGGGRGRGERKDLVVELSAGGRERGTDIEGQAGLGGGVGEV